MEGKKWGEWEKCNSIINKIYLKKLSTGLDISYVEKAKMRKEKGGSPRLVL